MKHKVINFFKDHYYILSGILIFLSFPSYNFLLLKGYTFFAWISLVPLFIYIKNKNFKEILLSSFISGFIGIYFVLSWIGNFGASVEGGYYVVLGFLIPSFTIFFVTRILIAEFLSARFPAIRFLIYPSAWIIVDWIQSIGFIAFPWSYWGYSQFQFTPFIQLSSYTGIMGVTFFLILFNKVLADLIFIYISKKEERSRFLKTFEFKNFAVLICLILLITGYGLFIINSNGKESRKDLKIAIIQTCISPWENWKQNRFRYLETLKRYTDKSLKYDPDLLIWSESATLENISYHYENGRLNDFEKKVLQIAKDSQKYLLTGEIGIAEDFISNRYFPQNNAVLIDDNGNVLDTYAKINLVPFGEWFPYGKWFPFIKDMLLEFGGSNFIPGDNPLLFKIQNRQFGVLICYEGIFYRLCREYKKMGAEFLINITNDGWTHSYAGHIQHFAAAKFRAIENGIWFVRAGNTGLTALIDPFGQIINSIPILEKGYLIGDIEFDKNHDTFYEKKGDLFLYLCMTFISILFIIFAYKQVSKQI